MPELDSELAKGRAQVRISSALSERHKGVSFNKPEYRALQELPSNLEALDGIVTYLNLVGTSVHDVSSLTCVKSSLRALAIGASQLPALEAIIEELPEITRLKTVGPNVAINRLGRAFRNIKYLELEGATIPFLSPPYELTALEKLTLRKCEVGHLYFGLFPNLSDFTAHKCSIQSTDFFNENSSAIRKLNLSFSTVEFSFLASQSQVESLLLRGFGLEDLDFLSEFHNLRTLNIRQTPIYDLTPLLNVPSLHHPEAGVSFQDTPATHEDPQLERISKIPNDWERTDTLLEYLEAKVDAEDVDDFEDDFDPPQDLPSAPVYILEADTPMYSSPLLGAEFSPDIVLLHEEVRRKATELIEASRQSNEYVLIRQTAEQYQEQISHPIEGINLRLLWSAANSLRRAKLADDRADRLHRDADMLPPKIGAALQDLVETHGVFIMGIPEAADLEAEMRSYLTGDRDHELRELGRQIADALSSEGAAVEESELDALQQDAATAQFDGPSGEMAEVALRSKLWNMIGAAGRTAWLATKKASGWASVTVLSHDFIQFLLGNETLVMSFLTIAQGKSAIWFPAMLQAVRAALGA
ncbi:MAG: hypothetical protein AAGK37_21855 [Pseudomonadota bacterium]